MIIERITRKKVEAALNRQAAVALLGARQVGKTTLAQLIGQTVDSHYVDLEKDGSVFIKNPFELLDYYQDRLLILDEIHLFPDLFHRLRSLIDQGRWVGNRTGRFLLIGSASIDIVNKSSQSLAGRIAFVEMDPVNLMEVLRMEVAGLFDKNFSVESKGAKNTTPRKKILDLWFRGGLPASLLSVSDQESLAIRNNLIQSYFERDVPSFGFRIPPPVLNSMLALLARNQGGLLNSASLAEKMGVGAKSVSRYIDLFENLFLVRKLPPYQPDVTKRLVKSPKIYVRDSGLLHALLGISEFEGLFGQPIVDASWEGFVIENLLSIAPRRTKAYFYRTIAGAEIDLILKIPSEKEVWAIEIKRDPTRLSRGFFNAIEDIQPDRAFVVYSGDIAFPVKKNVIVIGVRELSEMLYQLW